MQGAPPEQMGASYPHMFLIFLLFHGANAASNAPAGPKWQTLSGRPPQVIARGGFSGLFPDSSQYAYQFALSTSLPDVVLFCDLQFSSDSTGFCKTGLTLDNSTTVSEVFPKMEKTYKVHGEDVHGWFSLDFTADQLIQNVTLIQNIFSRPSTFDGSMGMYTLDDIVELRPPQIWLNVQYNSFFLEHKLSTEDYILGLPKKFSLTYISSTEIDFLKSLGGKLKKSKTKLVFRFLNEDVIEPSTKKTYGELLKDLKSIKDFAVGILVPKTYIWPLNKDQYLSPSTSLVKDAHALGLEVYASGFANDIATSYNYSYDPSAEYLQFIDNSDFSVDGVLTDFPPTASGAIEDTRPLIITHNGASGVFAGSTDLAYQEAIKDAADIIDCSVQMSKDGVAFCMHSADLSPHTTAATAFVSKSSTVHEIQNKSGIFSFELSWSEIQTLKPDIFSPFAQAGLKRNPASKNAGRFLTLPQFLDMAKASNVSGILIEMEHASYLAKRGLGVVESVSSALTKAGYDKETKQQVFIQSDDSSVLSAFKKFPAFKRVLNLEMEFSGASQPSLDDIKKFADGVRIHRSSVAQITGYFMTRFTDTVGSLQAANLTVFIGVLKNEFMNLGFDYFADPTVEIVTYSSAVMADGLITDYPATAASYFRSPCSDMSLNLSYSILPAQPGALVHLAAPGALAPAAGPAPLLEPKDVVDPPLPSVKAHPAWRHTTYTGADTHTTSSSFLPWRRSPRTPAPLRRRLLAYTAATARPPLPEPGGPPPLHAVALGGYIYSSRNLSCLVSGTAKASVSGAETSSGGEDVNEIIGAVEAVESTTPGASFLAKVAIAIGIAATVTVISLVRKQPSSGPSFSLPQIVDASTQSDAAAATLGYSFSAFGKKVIIPEYTPGGVCLSDMIPFFLGKLFRQTKASEGISSKIGIGKDKALSISRAVQKYGNLIGFVERFSIGVRNITAFLAGALGIPADCYFAGVCFGCLLTLPIQLALGFVLRERPVIALASVAAAVGICTAFPYAAAACTALFFYLRRPDSSS
uniref:glycerophosphodiester phosphodiesterase n=1 Tax=Setaria italica TaxID=4555 RepID=K3YPJ3_SETIT